MPYETWRRPFRRRAGVPPARYWVLRSVDVGPSARRPVGLLGYTTLPACDIAATVGFSDEHHLLRQVRAVTGLTPRQQRAASR